ncbi:glycoside hydrolase family 3 protein [Mobilitalea sibirica]|uniref:beta-glucosidase n=1 Tax=Mobilitalea sibirica TaxID=1462919 RepID=A0A8J7KXL8_9FIRM|nr:glycoside hydrolase family 3 protein [Mobilitalea sibirica]MBH1941937.1 glycoside hydrolase family 3 protein [Mobilitalea sibirica]
MKRVKLIALLSVVVLVFAGCFGKDQPAGEADAPSEQRIGQTANKKDNKVMPEALPGDTTQEKVEALLNKMTLEEKVGQMLQGMRDRVTNQDVKNLGLGSVLSGGGSFPGRNRLDDWERMISDYQDAALKTDKQIPIIYGVDAVHGLALVKDAVVFPQNIGLGAANDTELMYQMGAAVAEEMKLIRVPWNFSPCVAINTDPRWGRTYECFSSDPTIVTELAKAYAKGQSDHGVEATAKHYVADGGVVFGTGEGDFLIDRGDARLTEKELRRIHLKPYKDMVDSGIKIIMASFSSWNGVKMHENEYLLKEILKKEFGFQGFIVSDWEAVSGLSGDSYEENIILAVNAGIDMLMEPNSYSQAHSILIKAVKSGKITEERIDDAVSRILTVKIDLGLFEDPYMENVSHEVTELGSEKYRSLAKQLVEKSLVLLKNENDILPLKEGQKIFVTGPAMNDMGLQCGGWGLTWQGLMDRGGAKVTEGTTILEGLKEYGEIYGYEIITDKDRAEEADLVLLVIGEIPYAEYMGDTEDLSITGVTAHKDNAKAIELANSLDKPVVTLLVVGRNVLITQYMEAWDGIVMCYLPGSEGEGVASVLSGETAFTGKLPMPYYRSAEDIGKKDANLLFEFGYGLSYTHIK